LVETETIAAFIFILGSLLSLAVAWLASRRWEQPVWQYLTLIMLATFIWGFADGFEILSQTLAAKQAWAVFAYIGRMAGPPLVFLFAMHFSHLQGGLTPFRRGLLWVPFLLAMLLGISNPYHRLIWSDLSQDPMRLSSAAGHGVYFNLMMILSYIVLTAAILILLRAFWRLHAVYRQQAIMLTVALFLPLSANVLYFTALNPLPGIDLTSLGFAFSGLLLLLGIGRLQLLDLQPVYRAALFENMTEGMLVLNQSGVIVDLNHVAKELAETEPPYIGRDFLETFPEFSEVIQDLIPNEETRKELVLQRKSTVLDLSIVPLMTANGEGRGQQIVWRDIGALREAQAELILSERNLAVMNERERVSQELHDNLGQVLSYVSLTLHNTRQLIEKNKPDTALAQLEALKLTAEQASLDLRTLILEQQTISGEYQDFSAALSGYVKRFETISGLRVHLSLPEIPLEELLSVQVRMQFLRILQEAFANTHKHASAKRIEVVLHASPESIQAIISDDGTGFDCDADVLPEGFGLRSMSQRTLQSGGTFKVRSEIGRGTQIIVNLPRRKSQSTILANWRVLLVDDHPLFLEGMQALLEGHGLRVIATAQNAQEGLRLCQEFQPDLVLLDVHLPGERGPLVVRDFKSIHPEGRVVMLTMSSEERDLFESLQSGADGYLLKTQPPKDFFETLAVLAEGDLAVSPDLSTVLAQRVIHSVNPRKQAEQTLLSAGLSETQIEVLSRVAQSHIYRQIAYDLKLSESAVKYHMERIQHLLDLPNRSEAVAYAYRLGLVSDRRK
jgi:DNA-binding NarL/FixJ family response regulator/signal transduction histidine kinase